jgi:GNAT superfamily N-acetyltransferase
MCHGNDVHMGNVGLDLAPCTRPMVRASIRSTSRAQTLGQSCGQTEGTMSSGTGTPLEAIAQRARYHNVDGQAHEGGIGMAEIALRRAGPEDADAVRALTRAAYAKWCAVIGREPKPMEADYDRAVREHIVDLADADGVLIGLVEMIPQAEHLLIENVAVLPDRQGQGIGQILVARAEAVAAQQGFSVVRLYTNTLFAGNVRFYERIGYRIEREEKFKGSIVVHLAKTL